MVSYNRFKFFFLIFLLISFISCIGRNTIRHKTFLRKDVDISYIKKVAVLPFENHTKDENAGEIVRDIVITEILAMHIFDVVGKTFVNFVVNEETGGETLETTFSKETLKRIAKRLKVDGLIVGSVDEYKLKRDGMYSYPVITLTLRLIDGKSGILIWQTSGTITGYTNLGRLLGLKSKDINELTFDLVERLLSRLK